MIRTAILSVLPRDGSGQESEQAVAAVRAVLAQGPYTEVDYQVIPDEQAMIRARLRLWADEGTADLILTLGGIGAELRNRTPDATQQVIDRQFPGIPELLRRAGSAADRLAGLWRSAAGVRRSTLIVNLPQEPAAVTASLGAVSHLLVAAVAHLGPRQEPAGRPELPAGRSGRQDGR